ncbi:MAG: hypothetical protein ACLUHE_14210 [Christensenellales bacterium]
MRQHLHALRADARDGAYADVSGGLSVYVACTACQHVFAERAETSGIPESFCSYHKTMIGMAESGVLPKPLLIAGTTLACDANQLSFRRLAAHLSRAADPHRCCPPARTTRPWPTSPTSSAS